MRPIDADRLVAEIKSISDMCHEEYPVLLLTVINQQPIIDAAAAQSEEEKTGIWKDYYYDKIICSNCGSRYNVYDIAYLRDYGFPRYCPDCGARMKRVK